MDLWSFIIVIPLAGMATGIVIKFFELLQRRWSSETDKKLHTKVDQLERKIETLESRIDNRQQELEDLHSEFSFYKRLVDKNTGQ